MLFCALFGTPYEHQPLVPSLHSRNGATADFTGKNDTWYTLLRTPCVDFAARTMATTLLMPRPQLVHTTLPTQVSWIVRPKGGGQCGVTANASALAFEVACEGERPARFSGAWKEYKTQDFKAYMRASILNVKACGWEMNATRHETRTQVSGHAPWRYDLTLRPLALDAGQSRAKGMLAEAWLGESPGQHDDYGQRVDGFRYDVVTTSSEAQGLLAHPREAYESPGAPEPPQRTQPGSRAKEGEVIGWY